jgi:cytochrome c biogenesis protein CcmG/thiol:disulfide interchange protein DsbE
MSRLKLYLPLALFALLAGLLYRGLNNDPTELPSALIGQPFPAFQLESVESAERTYSVASLDGKVTLVNVWATWCFACRIEHAMLNQLAEQGVNIVGLNYKDTRPEAQRWLVERGDPYWLNLFDPRGELGFDLGVYGAPETYLVDADGIVRHRRVGVVDERIWAGELGELYRRYAAEAGDE